MRRLILTLAVACTVLMCQTVTAADPLRVFIRSGAKSHGPGAHDYPQFLRDWVPLLNERGAVATGGNEFPTAEQLRQTDVLILHAQDAGNIAIGAERKNLQEFIERGGGVVVIHAGIVSDDHGWFKNIVGGSWKQGQTKWLEGHMSLYFTDRQNPITKQCANFDLDDEIYYDLDILPEANILAAAYTPKPAGARNADAAKRAAQITEGGKKVSIYDIQPQMWTYEAKTHRAFVSIPGHLYKNFSHNTVRTILLRGIAWAGKRANVDELCKPAEISDALIYPEGGPTRPENAAEKIEVHPEFDIALVAAEPLINKPMSVDWDARGRLWVAETPEYPNGRRIPNTDPWKETGSIYPYMQDRDPQDRISILTDTNGDGVMDAKKVFADKLELVTSFVFHKNGVIVSSAPDIWYLEDTDGDDVADKRTKLYTGLGNADTHAVMNNLRWGQDGWIYATHGYSAGDVEALGAPKDAKPAPARIGSGVVRFEPDGSHIEMYSSRSGNTWGLEMTWDGQCFWTQPTSGTVFFHTVLPEYVLAKGKIPGTNSWKGMITGQRTFPLMKWEQQAYVQIDQVGSYTAAAGCAIYEGGAWPDKWNYSYFTGEATVNLVSHYFVKPEGVSYTTEKEKGREETEFVRSRDLWFRPIENRVGPDGALYLVDFYNQAVIHNDTRGPKHGPANAAVRPDRDHYFGRIWKIQHKQAKKVPVEKLAELKVPDLEKYITTSPNAHQKFTAWRLIREAGKDVAAQSDAVSKVDKNIGSIPYRTFRSIEAPASPEQRKEILERFAVADDDSGWTKSALIAAASDYPLETIQEALNSSHAARIGPLVSALLPDVFKKDGSTRAAALVIACAQAPEAALSLKSIILQQVAQQSDLSPEVTPEVSAAFEKLIASPTLATQSLPVIARWDKGGKLAEVVKSLTQRLVTQLGDKARSPEERADAARALITLSSEEGLNAVDPVLSQADAPPALQAAILETLGETQHADRIVPVFTKLKPELRNGAFDQVIKRPKAVMALLQAVQDEKIKSGDIGPGNIARLRTHPNREVSKRANDLMDKLNPGGKAKAEVIARLSQIVSQQGNAANGKVMFTAACAMCHKFGDVGLRDVGPPLTGMGAHGPEELLTHVVDPNREVDPSFWQWNITNKKGETFAGVIATENASSITLRNQGGDFEIKKEDIATKENTHRSFMPEGLEAYGGEILRDIFAFMGGADSPFRVVDLRDAYTADARRGLFAREEATNDSVFLSKHGNVTVEGIPFFLMDPARSGNGLSLVVLKGGGGRNIAQSFPQKIDINTQLDAKRIHLLSGIAGWGYPATDDARPTLKVTLTYKDGSTEAHELLNKVHFADYNREIEVPGSKMVADIVSRGQLRLITLKVGKQAQITKITLESYNNGVTPVVAAISADRDGNAGFVPDLKTAESASAEPKQGGRGDGPMPELTPVKWESGKIKTLLVGGGSSHDFFKFFGQTDSATLKAAGYSVHYTEDRDQAARELAGADVAVVSVNRQFFDSPAWRKALFDFADSGKGLILLHPGTWYAYTRWPEYNAKLVGGGSRGHDKLGPFKVNVTRKDHAIMIGVPASFEVVDELYYLNAEPDKIPAGTASIEVLAETSPSQKFGKPHPCVWITEHPKSRIVGITLGHDERVHDLDAFKTILINAVKWCSPTK